MHCKKFLTVLLVAVAIICLCSMASAAEAPSESPFTDVTPDTQNYAAIIQAYTDGLVSGYGDGTFHPGGVLTRAELYQTLAKACEVETGEAMGHWSGKAILYFQEQGIIPAGALIDAPFCNEPISRAEAVHAVYAVCDAKGIICEGECPALEDRGAIPAQYLPSIENAYRVGLIATPMTIRGSTYFYPNGILHRGELCEMLFKAQQALYLSSKEPAKVTVYTVADSGIEELEDEEVPLVSMVNVGDTTYYSLNDTIKALEGTSTETTDGFSKKVFYGSCDAPRYEVPATFATTVRGTYEFVADRYIWSEGGHCLTDVDGDARPYLVTDGEIYVAGAPLSAITRRTFANADGSLNILMGDSTPTFIAKSSSLSDEEKQSLTDSLWLLYNTYSDGYDIVTSYVKGVQSASDSYMDNTAGTNALACAPYRGNTVMWRKDKILQHTVEYNAGVLLHEATHFQQFTHGDTSEDQTVLNQGKAYYYIQKAGYRLTCLDTMLKSHAQASDPYHNGTMLLQQWMAAQER